MSKYKPILIFTFSLLLLASCHRVVIKVDGIPKNTPPDQAIYVTGNFNNWDPGDNYYRLELKSDSQYYITLPPGFGQVDYKFTRGDWTTVERGICGEETQNRSLITTQVDTAIHTIESWNDLDPIDCPKLTIVIEDLPENTPEDDIIAIASNLNSWDPDNASISKKMTTGERYITINRPPGISKLEYKLTRGDLSSAESDEFGNQLPNRSVEFGTKDTVNISVKGWSDIPETKSSKVVIILDKLPKNTPSNSSIFIASNLNSWISGDKNYEFQRNGKGQLFYAFPKKNLQIDFKITRDGWGSVEVDKNGYDPSNRQLNLMTNDTVFLEIARWKDMGSTGDDDITIILEKIPTTTPIKSKMYISGDFNNWNPGKLRYMFRETNTNQYVINLPRKNGDFEFRITRGSWQSAQIDGEGSDIPPYRLNYNDFDTVFIDVKNWKDLPTKSYQHQVTLVLDELPSNTPQNAQLYLAPDFNGWDPGDNELIFTPQLNDKLALTVPLQNDGFSYKITRGNWNTVEVNKIGQTIEDRIYYPGFSDTIHLKVYKWRDLEGNY